MDNSNYFLHTDIINDQENSIQIDLETSESLFENYSKTLKSSKNIEAENIAIEKPIAKKNISDHHNINSKKSILHHEL